MEEACVGALGQPKDRGTTTVRLRQLPEYSHTSDISHYKHCLYSHTFKMTRPPISSCKSFSMQDSNMTLLLKVITPTTNPALLSNSSVEYMYIWQLILLHSRNTLQVTESFLQQAPVDCSRMPPDGSTLISVA